MNKAAIAAIIAKLDKSIDSYEAAVKEQFVETALDNYAFGCKVQIFAPDSIEYNQRDLKIDWKSDEHLIGIMPVTTQSEKVGKLEETAESAELGEAEKTEQPTYVIFDRRYDNDPDRFIVGSHTVNVEIHGALGHEAWKKFLRTKIDEAWQKRTEEIANQKAEDREKFKTAIAKEVIAANQVRAEEICKDASRRAGDMGYILLPDLVTYIPGDIEKVLIREEELLEYEFDADDKTEGADSSADPLKQAFTFFLRHVNCLQDAKALSNDPNYVAEETRAERVLIALREIRSLLQDLLERPDIYQREELPTGIFSSMPLALEAVYEKLGFKTHKIIKRTGTKPEFVPDDPIFEQIREDIFSPWRALLNLIALCESIYLEESFVAINAAEEYKDIYATIKHLNLRDLHHIAIASKVESESEAETKLIAGIIKDLSDIRNDLLKVAAEYINAAKLPIAAATLHDIQRKFFEDLPVKAILMKDDREIELIFQRLIDDGLVTLGDVVEYLYDLAFHYIDHPNLIRATQTFITRYKEEASKAVTVLEQKILMAKSKSASDAIVAEYNEKSQYYQFKKVQQEYRLAYLSTPENDELLKDIVTRNVYYRFQALYQNSQIIESIQDSMCYYLLFPQSYNDLFGDFTPEKIWTGQSVYFRIEKEGKRINYIPNILSLPSDQQNSINVISKYFSLVRSIICRLQDSYIDEHEVKIVLTDLINSLQKYMQPTKLGLDLPTHREELDKLLDDESKKVYQIGRRRIRVKHRGEQLALARRCSRHFSLGEGPAGKDLGLGESQVYHEGKLPIKDADYDSYGRTEIEYADIPLPGAVTDSHDKRRGAISGRAGNYLVTPKEPVVPVPSTPDVTEENPKTQRRYSEGGQPPILWRPPRKVSKSEDSDDTIPELGDTKKRKEVRAKKGCCCSIM